MCVYVICRSVAGAQYHDFSVENPQWSTLFLRAMENPPFFSPSGFNSPSGFFGRSNDATKTSERLGKGHARGPRGARVIFAETVVSLR